MEPRTGRELSFSAAHLQLFGSGMEARARTRPGCDALEPRLEVFGRGGDRLAHARREIDAAIKNDVSDCETLRHDPVALRHQPVEPFHPPLTERFECGSRLGKNRHAVFEQFEALRVAEAVIDILCDVQLDAALPLVSFGALLGRRSDERRPGMLLFEIVTDGDRFADGLAVVEFERRQLSTWI